MTVAGVEGYTMAAIIVFSIIAVAIAAFSVAIWFDVDLDSAWSKIAHAPFAD